jgi:hypothetical protein
MTIKAIKRRLRKLGQAVGAWADLRPPVVLGTLEERQAELEKLCQEIFRRNNIPDPIMPVTEEEQRQAIIEVLQMLTAPSLTWRPS